jgi:hypothetical protein
MDDQDNEDINKEGKTHFNVDDPDKEEFPDKHSQEEKVELPNTNHQLE